jgi:hypothetical protein
VEVSAQNNELCCVLSDDSVALAQSRVSRIWMLRQCLLLLLPTLLPPDSSPGNLLRFFAINLCTNVSENVVKNHPKPCQFSLYRNDE